MSSKRVYVSSDDESSSEESTIPSSSNVHCITPKRNNNILVNLNEFPANQLTINIREGVLRLITACFCVVRNVNIGSSLQSFNERIESMD